MQKHVSKKETRIAMCTGGFRWFNRKLQGSRMFPPLFNFVHKFRCRITKFIIFTRIRVKGIKTTTIKVTYLPLLGLLRLSSCLVDCDSSTIMSRTFKECKALGCKNIELKPQECTKLMYWLPILASIKKNT